MLTLQCDICQAIFLKADGIAAAAAAERWAATMLAF